MPRPSVCKSRESGEEERGSKRRKRPGLISPPPLRAAKALHKSSQLFSSPRKNANSFHLLPLSPQKVRSKAQSSSRRFAVSLPERGRLGAEESGEGARKERGRERERESSISRTTEVPASHRRKETQALSIFAHSLSNIIAFFFARFYSRHPSFDVVGRSAAFEK